MFTGIIESTAEVLQISDSQIVIARPELFSKLSLGQSIAVNGACLSVVEFDKKSMKFDVVPETFSRTNLGKAKRVNLERAMPADGRFEGHIVLGHVDSQTKLLSRTKEGNGERFVFTLPPEITPFAVEKGSVDSLSKALTSITQMDPDELYKIGHFNNQQAKQLYTNDQYHSNMKKVLFN